MQDKRAEQYQLRLTSSGLYLERIVIEEAQEIVAESRSLDELHKRPTDRLFSGEYRSERGEFTVENLADKPYISAHCDLFIF